MESTNKENEKKILQIKIILNTNIPGKASFPLTKSTLYLRDLDVLESKPEEGKSEESVYPYFTTDVELPYADIESLGRLKSVEFFFDKELFRRKIATLPRTKNISKNDNARKNVITMLSIFFPTSFPIEENISDTFRTKIQELQTSKTKVSILPNFLSKFLFNSENNYSYIRSGGAVYSVVGSVWINDIINHPDYRKLLEFGKGISAWWEDKKKEINQEIAKKKALLVSIISENANKGARSSVTAITNSYINKKMDTIYNSDDKTRDNIDTIAQAIFELYFYIKYNEKDSSYSSRSSSNRDNKIPYNLRSEFQYDKIESIGLNIYKMQKTVDFFNKPYKYTELFESKEKKEDKSIELLKDEELKSEIQKYGKFLEFLKMAYQFSNDKQSSNPLLRDMIYFYLNSDSNENLSSEEKLKLKEKKKKFKANLKITDDSLIDLRAFLKTVHDVYIKGQKDKNTYPIETLETGVETVKMKKSDDKKEVPAPPDESKKEEFEIQVQVDVVKGLLNDETVGKISCIFRDSNLLNTYGSLTDTKHNKFEVNKKRFFVDINDLQREQVKKEASRKEKTEPSKSKEEAIAVKKGGKTIRRRRGKRSRRRTRNLR
jgi:hypothetical protein